MHCSDFTATVDANEDAGIESHPVAEISRDP